jgi:glycosyltransferase involved in cell wall biosynthesis
LYARGFDKVIYFDPDIAIYSNLGDMLQQLDKADVLLTPHITSPIDDGNKPGEREIMACGAYNLGYVAFHRNEQTQRFIKWWQTKLEHDCIYNPKQGVFVDQKWMEFAPSFCDRVKIVRHSGWNVAYWNMPTRNVEQYAGVATVKSPPDDSFPLCSERLAAASSGNESEFVVNGEPLVFFHFSGLDAEHSVFSKHQNRYTFKNIPPGVESLLKKYLDDLRSNGLSEIHKLSYAYAKFNNETPIPDLARKIFREHHDEKCTLFRDPAGADAMEFIRFVNEPFVLNGRSSPFITRLMREVFLNYSSSNLEEQFPDLLGVHARSFAKWFVGPGREFYKLHDVFVQPALEALQREAGNSTVQTRGSFNKWLYQSAFRLKNVIPSFIPIKLQRKIAEVLFRRAYVYEDSTRVSSGAMSRNNSSMETIAVYHNLLPGGSRKALYDLIAILRERYIIDLYQLTSSEGEFYNLDALVRNKYEYKYFPLFHKYFTNPYVYTPALIIDIFKIFLTARKVGKAINRNNYSFVFIHHDRYFQNPVISKYLQPPSVVFCQEPYRFFYEPNYDIDRRLGLLPRLAMAGLYPFHQLLKWVGTIGIKHADIILTNSYYTREYIYKAYRKWSLVTYLGIETSDYPNINLQTKNIVLSIGAINWRKNHELVIKALMHVEENVRPQIVVIAPIIGNKKEQKRIEEIARQCNVKITIEEKTSHEKLIEYYNSAIATICASIMEPFGLVAVESMSCGTPVIAVNEAGYRETIIDGETGYLVDRNEEAIADRILALINNDELRQRIGKNAMEHVRKNWDWGNRKKEIFSIIAREIAHCKRRPGPSSSP